MQAVERPDQVLREMLRIGKTGFISFINIGYWQARLQLAIFGHMPVTSTLPHTWFDTPNIRLATIKDFRNLCDRLNIKIVEEKPIG